MAHLVAAGGALLLLLGGGAVAGEPSEPLEEIEVVGTTPLGGAADVNGVAASVQATTAEDLRPSGASDLTE